MPPQTEVSVLFHTDVYELEVPRMATYEIVAFPWNEVIVLMRIAAGEARSSRASADLHFLFVPFG
ncbi:hypothetical protein EYF80_057733 [Liparis tanakae]|uniref:Uncharacterized protein n=1 Tax=Liparis tanakae TaxID=230148 RepID=A0A4Z2ETK0_9TELE|nr:hypothetical protein EYF80_057733 [Liparis tanakae]